MTLAQLKNEWDNGIGKEYGVILDFPEPKEGHWSGLTDEQYDFAKLQVEAFKEELRQYPTKLIQGSRLETLHLCGPASFGGRGAGKNLYIGGTTSRRIFHHEMWHVLDSSYEPWRADSAVPVKWVNPKGFVYNQPWPDLTGFASSYAQKAQNEDQADTAAYIWINGDNLHERIKTDFILRRKAVTIIKWYSSHGLKQFDYLATTWWKLKK